MREGPVAMTTYVLRVLTSLCLCGLVLSAPTKVDDVASLSERDINTIMLYFAQRIPYITSVATDNQDENDGAIPPLAKRFGIAGLDNVDMITSTLDRVRQGPRPRPRRPLMSMRFSMDSLRRMLDAGR